MSETISISVTDATLLIPIIGALQVQLEDETAPDPFRALLARLHKDLRRYGLSPSADQDPAALAALAQRLHTALAEGSDL